MLVHVEKVKITNKFELDPEMDIHIESYSKEFNKKLDRVIGFTDTDLEARFCYIRSTETNLANWVSDVIRAEFDEVDICLINGGTLRSNCVIPKGPITARTLSTLLPQPDKIVII